MKLLISGQPASSGGTITTQDEGTPLSSTVTTLNFTGAGVTASGAGATTTINISGGAGATWTEVEVDFGTALFQKSKSFVVTDSAITTSHKIAVVHSFATPTGKAQDDNEMDSFVIRAVSGAGQFTMYVDSLFGSVHDKFKFNYIYS